MITAQRKSSNAFARALSRDRVLFFCLKYPADTTDRYLQEFLSFHPDLPAHLDDIDIDIYRTMELPENNILSCLCRTPYNKEHCTDGRHRKNSAYTLRELSLRFGWPAPSTPVTKRLRKLCDFFAKFLSVKGRMPSSVCFPQKNCCGGRFLRL